MSITNNNDSKNNAKIITGLNFAQYNTIRPVEQRFELDSKIKEEIRSLTPKFGFNGLGEVVFRRTYSRDNESWHDVVIRVVQGTLSIRKEHYFRNSLYWQDRDWQLFARDMAISMFEMEWLPPGRGLWMMGTEFVYTKGAMALNNCAAVDTHPDLVLAAEWTMDGLMNGVGVGFSTYWRGEASIPDKDDYETYVIPDSREGWVESLIRLMRSYVYSPRYGKGKYTKFDYSKIRPAGQPIKGFGGKASGPEPLKKLHKRVESYLEAFCKRRLQTTSTTWKEFKDEKGGSEWKEVEVEVDKEYNHTRLVADIFNAIGACVVAGNVRRSAEISLGNVEDTTFINLKNYTENPERSEIGWMSNNSVVLEPGCNYEDFSYIPEMARRIQDNGEPGMVNLVNIQKFGRYGKEMKDHAYLTNPCGEIPLCSYELCNLSETFPPRCKNADRFLEAVKFATFYSSTVSLLPTHRPETNSVVAKNRRIGVSVSGIAQWASGEVDPEWGNMNYTKMTKVLRDGYKLVRLENERLAREAGIPKSVRVTTVKPSGSISLLAGVTPGMHYPVDRYVIRRTRIGTTSPLVEPLKKAGIPWEKDNYSDNTLVFEFVVDHGNVRPCEKVSPWEQFSLAAMMQKCWSDNSVSATIYFDKEKDKNDVEKMLAMYIPILKSVSMLPHSGHGYSQAPYEPINEDVYKEKLKGYTKPNFDMVKGNMPMGSKYCSNDTCDFVPKRK